MTTINTVLKRTRANGYFKSLKTPAYEHKTGPHLALAVESMRRHMTDEGWQIMDALNHSGYKLCGYNLTNNETHVPTLLKEFNPSVVVLQDKREWDVKSNCFREQRALFTGVEALAQDPSIFKLTILKDSHSGPSFHEKSADEIGCHAWIIYYHPRIVAHLAPYVRPQHLIRTYHTLDSSLVPPFSPDRSKALFSGAVSSAYPERMEFVRHIDRLQNIDYLKHPGYHRNGTHTPDFLKRLSQYKVSICTTSKYGYALRKIIESVACGCRVITDLPSDDVLPGIDDCLIRIPHCPGLKIWRNTINQALASYDPEYQSHYAAIAQARYDFRNEGLRLADSIDDMRHSYSSS